jgi:hypothetical protein
VNVFIYQAALLCEACGEAVRLTVEPPPGYDGSNESTWDSDDFPKGPYADGGGEADTPQHCDHCHAFLQNPLTPDGRAYLLECFRAYEDSKGQRGNRDALQAWGLFYGVSWQEVDASRAPRGLRTIVFDEDGPHDLGELGPGDLFNLLR